MEIQIKKATSLTDIREVAKKEAESCLSLLSAAEILVNVKKFETFLAEYKNFVKDKGIDELGQVTEVLGFRITKGLTTRYDYTRDAEYNELVSKLKEREAFLKSLKTSITEVCEETGEVKKIYPPIKKQSDRITITEI